MSGFDPWHYADRYKTEHANQAALFMWANMANRYGLKASNDPASYTERGLAQRYLDAHNDAVPALKWLHAVHNQGHGDAVRGAQAKAEGVKAGVFDLFLPVPRASQLHSRLFIDCGLYLELKVGKNVMSDKQAEFAADMTRAGYACECAWGWLEARLKLMRYLGLTL